MSIVAGSAGKDCAQASDIAAPRVAAKRPRHKPRAQKDIRKRITGA
jgi:hypothetical protein